MLKPRIPMRAKPGKAGARIKTAKPKWVPTGVESRMPWRRVSWNEQRERYKKFLAIVLREGHAERIAISDADEVFLQSFARTLDMRSTGGRIGKRVLITSDERAVLRELHRKLDVLGVRMPDIGFG